MGYTKYFKKMRWEYRLKVVRGYLAPLKKLGANIISARPKLNHLHNLCYSGKILFLRRIMDASFNSLPKNKAKSQRGQIIKKMNF